MTIKAQKCIFEQKKSLKESNAESKILSDLDYALKELKTEVLNKIKRLKENEFEFIVQEYGDDFPMILISRYMENPSPNIKKKLSKFRRSSLWQKIY